MPIPDRQWQKSTFSGGPEGDCLYLATAPNRTICIRESDTPAVTLATAPTQLAALMGHIRQSPALTEG
ncbi:DUF397 domain-containing protein [Streptomyces sp. NPDC048441]|uniref:DUF397 domain-containing protein n=1 Tax=Streptomyces sp. NPDC048441 TaxID=3365552 RepID=UPI00371F254F